MKICPLAISDINSLILTTYLEDRYRAGAAPVISSALRLAPNRALAISPGLGLSISLEPRRSQHWDSRDSDVSLLLLSFVTRTGSGTAPVLGWRHSCCHLEFLFRWMLIKKSRIFILRCPPSQCGQSCFSHLLEEKTLVVKHLVQDMCPWSSDWCQGCGSEVHMSCYLIHTLDFFLLVQNQIGPCAENGI